MKSPSEDPGLRYTTHGYSHSLIDDIVADFHKNVGDYAANPFGLARHGDCDRALRPLR